MVALISSNVSIPSPFVSGNARADCQTVKRPVRVGRPGRYYVGGELGRGVSERPNLRLVVDRTDSVDRTFKMAQRVASLGLLGLILALVVAVRVAQGLPPVEATESVDLFGENIVVVRPGQNIWDVAREMEGEGDVRSLVVALADLNGSADVHAGQELVVPASFVG